MRSLIVIGALMVASPAAAQDMSAFTTGPVFEEYGSTAPVETTMELPADAQFKVALDTSTGAEAGKLNRTLESAARFINMHVKAGVPEENIQLAVVIHGKASEDMLNDEEYAKRRDGAENANIALIAALVEHNVRVILCGQSAAAFGITNDMLAPGVEMALSAMTAHALLQQEGYTVNPF